MVLVREVLGRFTCNQGRASGDHARAEIAVAFVNTLSHPFERAVQVTSTGPLSTMTAFGRTLT